jgi:hypothetical protein
LKIKTPDSRTNLFTGVRVCTSLKSLVCRLEHFVSILENNKEPTNNELQAAFTLLLTTTQT